MGEAENRLRRCAFRSLIVIVGVSAAGALPGEPMHVQQNRLPAVQAMALDGHVVSLPRDLLPATVMIVGFSRGSADATTAWEIPVRNRLANSTVGSYDVAVLASVPGLVRGWVTRSIRAKVPPVLQPRFLPVFTDEAAWKKVCGYDPKAPDAPYVLLVDRGGEVLWRTHEVYSATEFERLSVGVRSAGVPRHPGQSGPQQHP